MDHPVPSASPGWVNDTRLLRTVSSPEYLWMGASQPLYFLLPFHWASLRRVWLHLLSPVRCSHTLIRSSLSLVFFRLKSLSSLHFFCSSDGCSSPFIIHWTIFNSFMCLLYGKLRIGPNALGVATPALRRRQQS